MQAEDDKIYIKIKDQGKGIRSEDREKYLLLILRQREKKWIGLAQSRKIMEAHKGSLSIISTGPRGTVFVSHYLE